MGDFFAELKRRRVIKAAVVYGLVGFAVIQAAGEIMPALGIPPWGVSFVVVLVLLGFPIALVLAWAYDLTPDGVVRTNDSTTAIQPRSVSWARWTLPIALLAAGSAYMLWTPPFSGPEASGASTNRYLDSLVVIPFANATGRVQYDQLSAGLVNQVINELLRIQPLKVINPYSADVLAKRGLTASEMADSLGARHILTGTLRLQGDVIEVAVSQVDAFTEAVLWAEAFTTSVSSLASAQAIIGQQIIERVLAQLPGIPRPTRSVNLSSGPSQLSYQIGSQWLSRRTPEGVLRAIESFTQAAEEQPDYALAHASLSQAYALALTYRYDLGLDSYTMARRALDAAGVAVSLDSTGAAGYAARGYIGALLVAPVGDVVSDFSRAAQLQPNSAAVATWSARALEMSGLFDEALAEAERAADLDPLSAGPKLAVAYISLNLGLYDKAVEFARKGRELEDELMLGRAIEARALLLQGNAEGCAAMDLGPHAALRATCLWDMGEVAVANALVDSVTAVATRGGGFEGFTQALRLEDLAVFYAWKGDARRAAELVARAYDVSPTAIDVRVYRSALFDRVRNQEFEEGVEGIRAQLFERSRLASPAN